MIIIHIVGELASVILITAQRLRGRLAKRDRHSGRKRRLTWARYLTEEAIPVFDMKPRRCTHARSARLSNGQGRRVQAPLIFGFGGRIRAQMSPVLELIGLVLFEWQLARWRDPAPVKKDTTPMLR